MRQTMTETWWYQDACKKNKTYNHGNKLTTPSTTALLKLLSSIILLFHFILHVYKIKYGRVQFSSTCTKKRLGREDLPFKFGEERLEAYESWIPIGFYFFLKVKIWKRKTRSLMSKKRNILSICSRHIKNTYLGFGPLI